MARVPHSDSARPKPPTGPTWAGIAYLGLCLAVLPVAMKWQKALDLAPALDTGRPWVDMLRTLSGDLALAAGVLGIVLALSPILSRSFGATLAFYAACTVGVGAVCGLSMMEHQLWIRSASLMDWHMLSYGVRHRAALQQVVAAESTMLSMLVLTVSFLAGMLCPLVDLIARRLGRWSAVPSPRALRVIAPFAVGCGVVASLPIDTAHLQPIARPAAATILWGAAVGGTPETPERPAIPAEEIERTLGRQVIELGLSLDDRPGRPRNVLIVILESTRVDVLGVYNPKLKTSPVLDALAEHAAIVDHALVDMPHTSKALVSILCGVSPRYSAEINEARLGGLPHPCLPRIASQLGLRTAFFQSADASFENRKQLVDNLGFDHFVGRQTLDVRGFTRVNYLALEDRALVKPLLSWIDAGGDAPFLATMLTGTTHHKYRTPGKFKRENLLPADWTGAPIPPEHREQFAQYLKAVAYVDDVLGDVVAGLRERDLLDDTLLVVVGDHGQGFHEHGRRYHNDVIYEEGLRVPLLFIHAGSFPSQRHVEGLRRQVDIVPTVLSLLGSSVPPGLFDGRNLLTHPPHAEVHARCWFDRKCGAMFRGDMKFIHHAGDRPVEVYDLSTDPTELHDLVASGAPTAARWEAPARLAELKMLRHADRMAKRFGPGANAEATHVLSTAPSPRYPVRVRLGDQLELLGFDAKTLNVVPGGTFEATLYLHCLRAAEPGWRLFFRLRTPEDRELQRDYYPANGRFDLTRCKPGMLIADRLRIQVPEDFPPGELALRWGSVRLKHRGPLHHTNRRLEYRSLKVRDPSVDTRRGLSIELTRLNVEDTFNAARRAQRDAVVLDSSPGGPASLEIRFGESLVLERAAVDPTTLEIGDRIHLDLVWRVEGPIAPGTKVTAELGRPGRGRYWLKHIPPVAGGIHPPRRWKPGTWVRMRFNLTTRSHDPTGGGALMLSLRRGRERQTITLPPDSEMRVVDGRLLLSALLIRQK